MLAFGKLHLRSEVFLRGTSEREATYGGNVAADSASGAPGSTYRLQLTPEFGFAEAASEKSEAESEFLWWISR